MNERLKSLLQELNTPAAEISKDLGKHRTYISHIVSGKQNAPAELYEYMDVRFNVNPAWLKYGEGEKYRDGGRTNNLALASTLRMLNDLPQHEVDAVETIIKALNLLHKYENGEQDE